MKDNAKEIAKKNNKTGTNNKGSNSTGANTPPTSNESATKQNN